MGRPLKSRLGAGASAATRSGAVTWGLCVPQPNRRQLGLLSDFDRSRTVFQFAIDGRSEL